MDEFDSNMLNGQEPERNQSNHLSIISDAFRAPQLNLSVPGHGGTSEGCQDMGEGGDNNDDSDVDFAGEHEPLRPDVYMDEDDGSDDDAEHVFGQEGVEESQIGTPGCRCSCHGPTWTTGRRLLDSSPPTCSGVHSLTSSRVAEYDSSGDHSLENTTILSPPSPSPSEFDVFFSSCWIDERDFDPTPLLRFSLVYKPLSLNPEVGFARNTDGPV